MHSVSARPRPSQTTAERQRASEASAHGVARVADEQAPLNAIHARRARCRAPWNTARGVADLARRRALLASVFAHEKGAACDSPCDSGDRATTGRGGGATQAATAEWVEVGRTAGLEPETFSSGGE